MSTVEDGPGNNPQHGDHEASTTDKVITELQKMQTLLIDAINRIGKLEKNQEIVEEMTSSNKGIQLTEEDFQSTKTNSSRNVMAIFGEKVSANSSLKIVDVVEGETYNEINLNLYDWENSILILKIKNVYSMVLGIKDVKLLVHFTVTVDSEIVKSLIPYNWKLKNYQINAPNVRNDKIVVALIKKISTLVKSQSTKCLVGRDGKWLLPITSALNTMDEMEIESIFDYVVKIVFEEIAHHEIGTNRILKDTESNAVCEKLIIGNLTPPLRHINE
ncbi:hypothetical protein SNEBB_009516, partial [Seison nebaliae]